ncbi:hypothetical protein CRG98_030196 [Punica granatum]|uniref:Uncharacterized protein n=1 Tax=Punica granatum TaxID=22663 RepID=A0A2I0IZI1_PUNGR|nr:hypothetical protein CRG98_030196 [Punica granatum]
MDVETSSHTAGYPKETRGYYFYNPTEGKVFVARTAVFLEKEFLFKGTSGRKLGLGEVLPQNDIDQSTGKVAEQPQGVVVQSSPQVTQEPRRSGRIRHEPERYGFLATQDNDVFLVDNDEPTTYAKAVTGPDSEKWLEAMRSEMEFKYTNQVWTLVDPLEGVKPIGCKWIFKKKTDMDGNVITFKGRLVAKGLRQVLGVDYDDTFSPVAMLKSIRILLAIAAYYDYEIWQLDVKTAFLNGRLLEDVYMTLYAPEFNLVGARMRAPKQTRLGSIHFPGDARRTHLRRSRHLPFYDPKVEGRQATRV